jgi:hypothetical protein
LCGLGGLETARVAARQGLKGKSITLTPAAGAKTTIVEVCLRFRSWLDNSHFEKSPRTYMENTYGVLVFDSIIAADEA